MSAVARADDVLHPGTPALDPPTINALGVALPITGDDNFSGAVSVRYRKSGTTEWHDGPPLMHVHTEAVMALPPPPPLFAGSIFDLAPDTAYDIELHAVDTDGGVDSVLMLSGRTRGVPAAEPAQPRAVPVTSAATLSTALAAAQAGDVITLAAGTYPGTFTLNASGTEANPIVIRGTDGAILDGGGCTGCNVLEVYGSFVHVEQLTIQHASRALRFQTDGAQANVVRRVHIRDVQLAIGSHPGQRDFYIADNVLEGRLVWPCVYTSDDLACNDDGTGTVQHGFHANDDGIHLEGEGHVVAHNLISGFGDAMKIEQDGSRSVDFVGNDVLWTYDNGVELDGSSRNTRALRNRFTNTFATLSFQPILGGPSYAIRNVLVNVMDEQFKLHSRGTVPTVGAVILHNTIVRGTRALQCSSSVAPLHFTVENNLFVGPATVADAHPVRWDLPSVATGAMDYNGYFPDGQFQFGYGGGGTTYPSFAALVAGGTWEAHGVLVDATAFEGGLVGTTDDKQTLMPVTPTLSASSAAIDRGVRLPGIDDAFAGAAPDLGAIEAGCDAPTYGPRALGVDETNEATGCMGMMPSGDAGLGTGDPGGSGGCCDSGSGSVPGTCALVLVVAAGLVRRRRYARL